MQGTNPGLGSPALAGPQSGPAYCFVGKVKLNKASQPLPVGSVLGTLETQVGVGVPLLVSGGETFGSLLPGVDQQTATVCGYLTFHDGLLALDVIYVHPGVNRAAPGVSPPALAALALLGLLPTAG